MFIECVNNNGTQYLRLSKSVCVTNKNGVRVSRKKHVFSIGPLSRFDDGEPDYVERLKKSFKAGTPLIPSLLPYCENKVPVKTHHIIVRDDDNYSVAEPKYCANILLERIMEELGLHTLFASYKAFSKIKYDVYGFAKLLIFGRILDPASKYATVRQNDDYYIPILKDFNPDNVYDTLDFIYDHKDQITRRINTHLVNKAYRSTDMIFYDVTNFYCEIEDPDEDVTDEDGNVIEVGIRKKGVSKEERSNPIVQMGLFMDNDGVPIAVESFPGNTLDHLTLQTALKNNVDNLDYSRFILVADRGICSYPNLLHVTDNGNGYIVSKSLKKCKKEEREWAYSDEDYISVGSNFKYKSRIVRKEVKDAKGNKRVIEEKVIVYWSKKFYDRDIKENKKFLAFLKKLQEHPGNFRVTAKESKGIKKYFKKEFQNIATGELVDSTKLRAFLDFDKIEEFKKNFGYYQIVTSELDMNELDVIDKYHGLTRIEDQFRVMKGTLETRPFWLRTPEHIEAHMLICMIALIVVRLIQIKIVKSGKVGENPESNWSFGLSADRIQRALRKWGLEEYHDDLYRFANINDPDVKIILDAFNIKLPHNYYKRADIKHIKTSIKIFD